MIQSWPNFAQLPSSFIRPYDKVSIKLDQNCGFFTNNQFLGQSNFLWNSLYYNFYVVLQLICKKKSYKFYKKLQISANLQIGVIWINCNKFPFQRGSFFIYNQVNLMLNRVIHFLQKLNWPLNDIVFITQHSPLTKSRDILLKKTF